MSGITIFMEGGGASVATRAALRQGMDTFLKPLKQAARAKAWHWNVVCRGPRGETFRAFHDAARDAHESVVVLLVDAEGPVAESACRHLQKREGWDLSAVPSDQIHLMVQAMEAWFVADPATLSGYYGQGFRAEALRSKNVEDVTRYNLNHWLRRATQDTGKGRYHKVRHASDLLKLIDRNTVATRCSHCGRLFKVLGDLIATS